MALHLAHNWALDWEAARDVDQWTTAFEDSIPTITERRAGLMPWDEPVAMAPAWCLDEFCSRSTAAACPRRPTPPPGR